MVCGLSADLDWAWTWILTIDYVCGRSADRPWTVRGRTAKNMDSSWAVPGLLVEPPPYIQTLVLNQFYKRTHLQILAPPYIQTVEISLDGIKSDELPKISEDLTNQ